MIRFMGLVCVLVFAATSASAQLYVEGRVGVAIVPDSSSTFVVPPFQALPGNQSFGTGATGGVAVGYGFDFGARVEVNMQIQGNSLDQLRFLGYVDPKVGDAIILSPMVDLLYDIRLGDLPFVPFVGGGLGLTYTTVSASQTPTFQVSGSSTAFAWEVVGGVAWELSDSLALTANYRYLDATSDGTYRATAIPISGGLFEWKTGISAHTITAGVRLTFAAGGGGS